MVSRIGITVLILLVTCAELLIPLRYCQNVVPKMCLICLHTRIQSTVQTSKGSNCLHIDMKDVASNISALNLVAVWLQQQVAQPKETDSELASTMELLILLDLLATKNAQLRKWEVFIHKSLFYVQQYCWFIYKCRDFLVAPVDMTWLSRQLDHKKVVLPTFRLDALILKVRCSGTL